MSVFQFFIGEAPCEALYAALCQEKDIPKCGMNIDQQFRSKREDPYMQHFHDI